MFTRQRLTRLTTLVCSFTTLLALGACTQTVQAPESTLNLRTAATTYVAEDLGTLGGNSSYVQAVSADGSVVVGSSNTTSGESHAFRWTASGGMQDLGKFSPIAVSANGAVVVGNTYTGNDCAFRWTAAGGMEDLDTVGGVSSRALAVSADGSVVVGWVQMPPPMPTEDYSYAVRAFRWTAAGGMEVLGTLPGNTAESKATSVSADGSVVVGLSYVSGGDRAHAFRWTASGGMQDLGLAPGSDPHDGQHVKVSADGSVVIGSGAYSTDYGNDVAFRWTAAGGREDLGTLPGGRYSIARALSADGSVVVGWANTQAGEERAFRWTASGGMKDLGTLGSMYSYAFGVSADGSVVVGTSTDASERQHAFVWTAGTGIRKLDNLEETYDVEVYAVSADGSVVVGRNYDPSSRRNYPVRWVRQFTPDDGDGVASAIDGRFVNGAFVDESTQASTSFTDQHVGGTTYGTVSAQAGDFTVNVEDISGAEGVTLSAQGSSGSASVVMCGEYTLSFRIRSTVEATCGSLLTKVVTGSVNVNLSNGAVVSSPQGAVVFIDEQPDGNFTVENRSSQDITITFEGETRTVAPGESAYAEPQKQIDSYTITFDRVPVGRVISNVKLGSGIVSDTGTDADLVYLYAKRNNKSGNTAMVTGTRRELIISKDGRSQTSYTKGGNIGFGFTKFGLGRVAVKTLKVTGVTASGGFVEAYDGGTRIKRVTVPKTGTSGSATLAIAAENVSAVRVYLNGVGKVDDLTFASAAE